MHVLMLPSFYSDPDQPLCGSFFRDQALALSAEGVTVGIAYVEPRSLRRFRPGAVANSHFQIREYDDHGVRELRMHGWNTLDRTRQGAMVWAQLTLGLYERYVQRCGTPDLLHAHNALYAGYAASLIAGRHGVPYLVTEHHSSFLDGGPPVNRHDLIRRAYGGASWVIAVSSALERAVTPFTSCGRQVIIPNLVDTDFFAPPECEPAAEPYTIVTIARLVAGKRIDLLIRAFAACHARNAGVRLVIGGDGPCRGELEETCRHLGIRELVTFSGALTRKGVRDLLRSAHLFVLPSSVETFGIVLIEALATGVPVVATRSGGPEEIVTDSCGLLVAPDDVEGLELALRRMHEERGRYGRAGLRARAVESYGHRAVAGRLVRLYGEVLAETASEGSR